MKKIILFIMSLFIFHFCNAQNTNLHVISSSGNYYNNFNLSMNFTIGESIISTVSFNQTVLSQGFNQPNIKIYNSNSEINPFIDNFDISIFPNPASKYIEVLIDSKTYNYGEIKLYDLNGKNLMSKNIEFNHSKIIDLNSLSSGFYFLSIYSISELLLYTYKIEIIN